jgi:2-polyprenyl-6-methoxyphenol hydroxylase-like FAD-dependent oxidoreductase
MNTEAHYDAIVVGARVAGASTAMLLARAGRRVLVLDRNAAGTDTTSTHALMRAGVMQLRRWGLLDRVIESGAPPIRRTTFHYGNEAIEIAIGARYGVDALYAPRRITFDGILAGAAREASAEILYGASVEKVLRSGGRVTGVEFRDAGGAVRTAEGSIVIGADGASSRIARTVDAGALREGRHACAVIYGYFRGLDLDGTHWHFARDVAAGAIPTHDGLACVFASMRSERYEAGRATGLESLFHSVLKENDGALAHVVARAPRESKLHSFAGRPGFIRRAWGPGWALVGDAGCFKDPLTAHGMTDALRDTEFLVRALLDGTEDAMARYQQERDAFAFEFLDLSDEVGSLDWDYDRIKVLHHRLSKLMNRECDRLEALDAMPTDGLL